MFNLWKNKEKRDPDDFTPPKGLNLIEEEKFFQKLLSDPNSNYVYHYLQPPAHVMSNEEWQKKCEIWKEIRKRNVADWRKTKVRLILIFLLLLVIAFNIWY